LTGASLTSAAQTRQGQSLLEPTHHDSAYETETANFLRNEIGDTILKLLDQLLQEITTEI
jgi:hypothetical protein